MQKMGGRYRWNLLAFACWYINWLRGPVNRSIREPRFKDPMPTQSEQWLKG
jgi:hypothetical protein